MNATPTPTTDFLHGDTCPHGRTRWVGCMICPDWWRGAKRPTFEPSPETHIPGCAQPGWRYVSTIRSTPTTRESGTAGKVVMLCNGRGCPARRLV